MSWPAFLLSLTVSLLPATGWRQVEPRDAQGLVPPARPVFDLLKAVKEMDRERLKTVFSEAMRTRFDDEGWDKALTTYRELFEREFADYRLEDFTFEYDGGEQEGKVSVEHKGKKLPGLRVIKEPGGWKVNER